MSFGSSRFPWRLFSQQFFPALFLMPTGVMPRRNSKELPRMNLICVTISSHSLHRKRFSRTWKVTPSQWTLSLPPQSPSRVTDLQCGQQLHFRATKMQSSTNSTTLGDTGWVEMALIGPKPTVQFKSKVMVWCQRWLSKSIAESCVEVRCERRRID